MLCYLSLIYSVTAAAAAAVIVVDGAHARATVRREYAVPGR